MALYKTRGIVLKRHNLGEADRIITFLTSDRGVVRAVARGVRKIKSRMAGHLELFCEADLMLAEGKNLDVITSARLLHYGKTVTGDWQKLQQAYMFAEMIDKLAGEHSQNDGLFEVMQSSYRQLDARPAEPTLELWFKLNLLDRLGHRPRLEGCVICGEADATKNYVLVAELGGLADTNCAGTGQPKLSPQAIKLWRVILVCEAKALSSIQDAARIAGVSLPACDRFIEYTFGRRFESASLLA
ncbi:MAG TPA: DNA repair protein RecO [Candidatus Dormibacteraeota bacterium]|nr:DNA repair protein RecO [Candidatus Dormibacteraeota bacterium]